VPEPVGLKLTAGDRLLLEASCVVRVGVCVCTPLNSYRKINVPRTGRAIARYICNIGSPLSLILPLPLAPCPLYQQTLFCQDWAARFRINQAVVVCPYPPSRLCERDSSSVQLLFLTRSPPKIIAFASPQ
jgi:hypothetical protein